jgi:hypothetical protein
MSVATRRALYGKMAGDSALTTMLGTPATGYTQSIYHQDAPKGAGFPFIAFNLQAGSFTHAMQGGASIYEDDLWLIKGVDRAPSADIVDGIASRLEALLSDGLLTISGRTQMWLRPQQPIEYSEVTDGEMYRHSGRLFRLVHQAT